MSENKSGALKDFELHMLNTSGECEAQTKRLTERRISPEVIVTFQIKPRGNGWEYPTPSGGVRWKNYDSNASPKYQWLDSKSESAERVVLC